jgi:hypothetical protein
MPMGTLRVARTAILHLLLRHTDRRGDLDDDDPFRWGREDPERPEHKRKKPG